MSQPWLTLNHFHGVCSQVAVCALESARLDYRLELVILAGAEQTGVACRAISPLGKVRCC